jgi:hypothetical protein
MINKYKYLIKNNFKLYDFFKQELPQYLTADLHPKGREIIEACLRGATVEEYAALI